MRLFTDIKNNSISYLLIFPAFLYTFIYGYLTLPYMLISFQKFSFNKNIFNSPWVGFKNYEFFFGSPKALEVTVNTLRINFLYIILGAIFAVIIAVLLNEIRSKYFLKINQSVMILPYFLSWVIVSYVVYALFSTDYGVINRVLSILNIEPINWYLTPKPWVWILVFIKMWREIGIQVVIYLAAITGMDKQIYEAATIDGANRWQQNMKITLPLLLPTVVMLALISVGRVFNGDFAMIYSIIRDNGLLYPTTDVIDTYVFRALRKTGDASQAMAVGVYQSVFGFITVYICNRLTRRYFKEGSLF